MIFNSAGRQAAAVYISIRSIVLKIQLVNYSSPIIHYNNLLGVHLTEI